MRSVTAIRSVGVLLLSLLFFFGWECESGVATTMSSQASGAQTKSQAAPVAQPPGKAPSDTSPPPQKVPGASPDFRAATPEKVGLQQAVRSSFFARAISEYTENLKPNQGGIVWLAVVVTALVAFNFRTLVSLRNLDLLLILAPTFLMIDMIRFSNVNDPAKFSLAGYVFLGIYLCTVALFIRAMWGAFASEKTWAPNLSARALAGLMLLLLACNAVLAIARNPDDCGIYTNIGAKRMLETGKYPYGDPLLRGGAAATYGPILYFAHMPFQLILPTPKADSQQEARTASNPFPFIPPPLLATKLTLLFFHLLGIAALAAIGRRLGGPAVGWGLVCLYIGSAYVQGIGGEKWVVGGMAFISHIAPAAVTLLAFACLNRPLWAGVWLGIAAGVLFYPAFFFPLWFGYYFWKRAGWLKFTVGFAVVCLLIGASVMLLTQTGENESVFRVIYESTIGHQESPTQYGSSTFSFWGTHPRVAGILQQPLIAGWYLLKPLFMLFVVFLGASFFMAKGRTITQLAFLTAAVAIAIQLWKSHADRKSVV